MVVAAAGAGELNRLELLAPAGLELAAAAAVGNCLSDCTKGRVKIVRSDSVASCLRSSQTGPQHTPLLREASAVQGDLGFPKRRGDTLVCYAYVSTTHPKRMLLLLLSHRRKSAAAVAMLASAELSRMVAPAQGR